MMHNTWQISQSDCYRQPFPHIYCKNFIKLDTYDHLYEQWNNQAHERWKTFIDQNDVELYFHKDFIGPLSPRPSAEYIGYWFFKQRTDRSNPGDIHLSNSKEDKILKYYQNTIFIFHTTNTFVVTARKDLLPTRPFCEIYFSEDTNKKIKELLS